MIRKLLLLVAVAAFVSSCGSSDAPNDTNKPPADTSAGTLRGTITLSVRMNDSCSLRTGDTLEVQKEFAQADYSFELPKISLEKKSSSRSCFWADVQYGGSLYWLEENVHSYNCGGTIAMSDRDTLLRTFSTDAVGRQSLNMQFAIADNGTYGITISPLYNGHPTREYHSRWKNCPAPSNFVAMKQIEGIPFTKYFTPFIGGLAGSYTGKIDTTAPKQIKGTFNGKDTYVVFDRGTILLTVPITITTTWDLTLE